MRMLVSTLALSVLLLSAGAFANNEGYKPGVATRINVTVILKNNVAPVLPPAIASCAVNHCVEV